MAKPLSWVDITIAFEFEFSSGVFTDATADVLISPTPRWDWGIRGTGPLDLISSPGTFTFAMRNDDGNSGGLEGYYSPGHTNVRSGWEVGIGVRIAQTYSGATTRKLYYIKSIKPTPGKGNRKDVLVLATDWADWVATVKLADQAVLTDQGDKTTFLTIRNALPGSVQPSASNPTNDIDVFPYVFDNVSQTRENVLTMFQRLAQSSYGRIVIGRDVTDGEFLSYQNRHSRMGQTGGAFTFDGDSSALEVIKNFDQIINVVDITVPIRRVDDDATTVLYSLEDDTPVVPPSETITIFLDYRDPNNDAQSVSGVEMVDPVATTDFTMNRRPDGTGADVTSDHTVTATFAASQVQLAIQNTGTEFSYITLLQGRGKGLYAYADKHVRVEDATSVAAYGERLLSIRLPWNTDVNYAEQFAAWLLTQYQDEDAGGIRSVRMTYIANRHGDLANQARALNPTNTIDIGESVTGLSAAASDFWTIHHVTMEWVQRTELRVTYLCQHNDADPGYWRLGASANDNLGVDTKLGHI